MTTLKLCLLAAGLALTACTNPVEPAEPLVGGYVGAAAEDANTKAAEQFAITSIYEAHPTRMLAETISREQQVVAGINYKFRIGFGGGNGDFRKSYDIVVYRDLDGNLSVSSLEEVVG